MATQSSKKSALPELGPVDYLIFDISNLLYRSFYANTNEDVETIAGLACHSALTTLNKYYKQYPPTKRVVMALDRKSWRKEYTASEGCVSKRPYKGNRRKDMSPSQAMKYERFLEHLSELEQLLIDHTAIVTLYHHGLEADDVIAEMAKVASENGETALIISTDSDLHQLLQYKGVQIVSPATDTLATLAEFDNDPLYYVFQKCVRGDTTDNVQSAYPRVRQDKIKAAFTDPFARVQMMSQTWTDQEGTVFVVKDLFEENRVLIDLTRQPDDIKQIMTETVSKALANPKKCSLFHILKFVGKHDLRAIQDNLDQYLPMLSHYKA